MFRYHLIIAIRYLLRNRLKSIIEIFSLTIGMAVLIQIGLYVDHELGYDKFNKKIDRIYRLEYGNQPGLPSAVGHEIKEDFGGIENVVRTSLEGSIAKSTINQGQFNEKTIRLSIRPVYCDSTVFDVFTLPLVKGDPSKSLKDPYSVVLSETTAKSLFGNQDPLGKRIEAIINTQMPIFVR